MTKHVDAMTKPELIKLIKERDLSALSASALNAKHRTELLRMAKA